jgi:hypothetical protein
MDLAGLFIAIVGGIFLVYAVVSTVVIAAVNSMLPKGKTRDIVWFVLVLFAICAPFAYLGRQDHTEQMTLQTNKQIVAEACRANEQKQLSVLRENDVFIDRRFLKMVVEPVQESFYFDRVIQYFLRSKLNSLETQNSVGGGSTLVGGDKVRKKIIKLSIADLSDPRCKTFNEFVDWERYASLNFPWVRELGLVKGSCMALELNDQISSNAQITLHQSDIELSGNPYWMARYDIDLIDTSTEPATKYATLVEHYSGGGGGNAGYHYGFPCGEKDNRRVLEFNEALVGQGNQRVRVPTISRVSTPIDAVSNVGVSKSLLSKLHWDSVPEQSWVTGVISSDRTVWLSNVYVTKGAGQPGASISLEGYELNILGEDVIYRTPITIGGVNSVDITGLARTTDGFALIAFLPGDRRTAKRYLLQYDKQGRNVAASELTVDEYEQTKDSSGR